MWRWQTASRTEVANSSIKQNRSIWCHEPCVRMHAVQICNKTWWSKRSTIKSSAQAKRRYWILTVCASHPSHPIFLAVRLRLAGVKARAGKRVQQCNPHLQYTLNAVRKPRFFSALCEIIMDCIITYFYVASVSGLALNTRLEHHIFLYFAWEIFS